MKLNLPTPHDKQRLLLTTDQKRIIAKCGRRWGKTVGAANRSVRREFLHGLKVLYGCPTSDQTNVYWDTCKLFCRPLISAGYATVRETERVIRLGSGRIKAKTAWDADSLRGDFADLLILDEWQLMDPKAWKEVGAPMLADRDGTAIFLYTPPSIRQTSERKRISGKHARQMWKDAEAKGWLRIHGTSLENPHLSESGLSRLVEDMSRRAYRQEILAEDEEVNPHALWTREIIKHESDHGDLRRVVIGVDPSGSKDGDEVGIVVSGVDFRGRGVVLEDASGQFSPHQWAVRVCGLYDKWEADRVVAEVNYGGDMVVETLRTVDATLPVRKVHASRGKMQRAEPVSALYEKGRVIHAGEFAELEDELLTWDPGASWSPGRLDAVVWALTDLMLRRRGTLRVA